LTATGCGHREGEKTVAPVKVKVTAVQPTATGGGREYSGTIEEKTGTTLSFPVSGTIRSINVTEGQRVSKGSLIATLDDTTLKSDHEAAVAALEQAEDAYQRYGQLHDNNSLPEIQWVETQSKLRQARSAVQITQKNLNDSKLYAPFSGVISEKSAETGQNVAPGNPVVKLVTVDRVKVSISVPEDEISSINLGQAIGITVPALGGKSFSGKIAEKGISANTLSRSYEVKAIIDNPAGELMPGMLCNLYVTDNNSEKMIAIPAGVVQLNSDNRTFVWLNRQGKAHRQFIVTGQHAGNDVIVISGLTPGDQVIVEGQQKVSDDMAITVN